MAKHFDPRVTPWEIDPAEFSLLRSPVEKIEFLLRYAVLAPSGHNTQPWRFQAGPRGVRVFADYSRRLPEVDPENRELLMSVGAAILNLRVAAAHFDYHCAVLCGSQQTMPQLVATIDLWPALETERIDEELKPLFPAIPLRHTNRRSFEPRLLSQSALEKIEKIEPRGRAAIRLITSSRLRTEIAQLVGVGDRIQMASDSFRREVAAWIRPSSTSEGDGLPVDAIGIPSVLGPTSGWFIRHFDVGASIADRDYRLSASAPALALIEADDEVESLLAAGELLEHLLLTLTSLGIHYSYVNQTVQVPGLRIQLRRLVRTRMLPQVVLRIGYGRPVKRPAPRRSVGEVVHRQTS